MTTEALEVRSSDPLTALEMRSRVNRLQEVMQAVMIGPSKDNPQGVHFGIIPGTDKPTLYKAGAEKILMTFRIAAVIKQIEDLGIPGEEARYRITVQGVNQINQEVLGEGTGECSSYEEKYKWRRPVHDNEFTNAPLDRRREKYARDGKVWKQVRTESADVANTILKMAVKRALVAMTLVVTAASDVFAQDIEDLPEELRETAQEPGAKAPVQQPQRVQPATAAPAVDKKPEPSPAPASRATFDPSKVYTLKRSWQPNANKDYRFLELVGATATFIVHVWDAQVIAAVEGRAGARVKVSGKESTFDAAPFQVKALEFVEGREPGAEG